MSRRVYIRASYSADDPMLPAIQRALQVAEGSRTLRGLGDLMSEPATVKAYLENLHASETQETTGAIYLNVRNRFIAHVPDIYKGTLDRASVEPREILKQALLRDAASVIIYHNHPSGDATPSREDREFTRRLSAACEHVGVRLLDHIVVASGGSVSFREAGLL